MLICVSRANRDFPAYSSRYTAQAMPMGKATTATMMQIHSVPQMASHRPASAASRARPLVRKLPIRSVNTAPPSAHMSSTSTMRMSSEMTRQAMSAPLNTPPFTSRLVLVSDDRTAASTEPSTFPRGVVRSLRHQYTSRTRRTNRSATTFSSRVIRKSSSPTKYRLWNARSSPFTWSEPAPSAAMAAVIV